MPSQMADAKAILVAISRLQWPRRSPCSTALSRDQGPSDFFAKLNEDGGDRLSHLALRWTILTMVRSQETRFAKWSEFEGLDTSEPLWRIPPDRMKMRSEHLVPLPPQAAALLDEIRRSNVYLAAGNMKFGRYLFGDHVEDGTISEDRMLDIMYRVFRIRKARDHPDRRAVAPAR